MRVHKPSWTAPTSGLCRLLFREAGTALAVGTWVQVSCLLVTFFYFSFYDLQEDLFLNPVSLPLISKQISLYLGADLILHRSQVPTVPPQLPLCRDWQEGASPAVEWVKALPPLIFLLRP